ncbi:hypothetical protein UlMin_029090 [Ulmus minor]
MVERTRPRSYGVGRGVEIVNARTLNDNRRVMYLGRSRYPSLDPSPFNKNVVRVSKSSSQSLNSWWNDPEIRRKRRVAKYKFYGAEGKVKQSLKKGFRWLGKKCAMIIRRI